MVKKRSVRKKLSLFTAFKAMTLVLTLYYSLAMPVLSGAGLIYNRESYGERLAGTGILFIISAVLMTIGAIFCMFRKNFTNALSPFLSVVGCVICMVMLCRLTDHADAYGWTDKFTFAPVSDMYKTRIIPCIAPVAATVTIAVIQFFSYDLSTLRREKKRKKKETENAPSPSVLGDD